MYLLKPSIAHLKYVAGNLKALHGFGAHATLAAYIATAPTNYRLHPKYNVDVVDFEYADAQDDVAIVTGYKYEGSVARREWLADRGLAGGYWADASTVAVQVLDDDTQSAPGAQGVPVHVGESVGTVLDEDCTVAA